MFDVQNPLCDTATENILSIISLEIQGHARFLTAIRVHVFLRKKDRRNPEKRNKLLEALNNRLRTVDFPSLTQIRQWMKKESLPSIFEILITSISIMETQITAIKLKTDPPDILIQPDLGHLKFLEFNRAGEAIAEGYKECSNQIKKF